MSKKKSKPNPNHLKHIRVGPIAADIFRASQAGHSYLYFEISRAWSSGSSKNWSRKLYGRNEHALVEVVAQASRWIEEHPEAADGPVDNTENPQLAA